MALWCAWAWHTGNDTRHAMNIWRWLVEHDKPTLNRAFDAGNP